MGADDAAMAAFGGALGSGDAPALRRSGSGLGDEQQDRRRARTLWLRHRGWATPSRAARARAQDARPRRQPRERRRPASGEGRAQAPRARRRLPRRARTRRSWTAASSAGATRRRAGSPRHSSTRPLRGRSRRSRSSTSRRIRLATRGCATWATPWPVARRALEGANSAQQDRRRGDAPPGRRPRKRRGAGALPRPQPRERRRQASGEGRAQESQVKARFSLFERARTVHEGG